MTVVSTVVDGARLPPASWRRWRLPVAVGALVVAVLAGLAILGSTSASRTLDPANVTPSGAHALAALLRDRGITVSTVQAPQQLRDGATVVVADPAGESDADLAAAAAHRGTVLLVAPRSRELHALHVSATVADQVSGTVVAPGCTLPAAAVAGQVRIAGDLYHAASDVQSCYADHGDAALLVSERHGRGATVVLGSASTLDNDRLATQGDAALALGLLDAPVVQWLFPGPVTAHPVGPRRGLIALLPERVEWATLQLFLAAIVVALWRARRLGAPVVEPLPVVVRAAETVEGHGRLLRAAQARSAAAAELRAATVRRLAAALRIGEDRDPATVSALVAERNGRPVNQVSDVLYGADPVDDAALVRLAQALSDVEASVAATDRGMGGIR